MHHPLKHFTHMIRQGMQDFSSFLLTKERTHFSILSFALTYPGLVHFIHVKKGVVASPHLVDLNERDKHHEILHEIFGLYGETVPWRWPAVPTLKRLGETMLYGLARQHTGWQHEGFRYLYLAQHDVELVAVYFGFVPKNRIWAMHRQLLADVSQRHYSK